ncbi:MAG TPA: ABC transporter substrate-binding protein [Stellaceae bacterium]|jgi:ABC-type branched-subunit amino acid transport system substrate-binding protein
MKAQRSKNSFSRRRVLQAAAAAAGTLPFVHAPQIFAAEESIGNWPAGAQGPTVFVGVTTPLTGPYSADGIDHLKGYQLAIEHLNNGEGLVPEVPSLKGKKGVLGKKIVYKNADTQTQPNPAIQAQTDYITQDKAIMITGALNSAVAIAIEKLAQRYKVLNMVGCSGANETTGVDCQKFAFRSQPSAYMAAKALTPVLGKVIGRNKKAIYLVPDYAYGHSVEHSTGEFTEQELGWKSLGSQVCPLGTKDYSSYLLNIANSGADVFVNVAFGADAVASCKQAKQFGVLDKMKMVVPNISAFQGKELGPEIMGGVYGTMDFWWTLAESNRLAKIFVDTFHEKFNYRPSWPAHIAYTQMMVWADAVTRAGSFDPVKVIAELEAGHKLQMPLGEVWYRKEDHQQVRAVPVVVGKTKAQMRNDEDFFEIVGMTPGPDVMPPDFLGCKLPSSV